MPRTQVTGDQVADNTITTDDIQDFTVRKEDIDITTPGQALIISITSSDGSVAITESGADPGTGVVDLVVDVEDIAQSFTRISANVNQRVPGGRLRWLEHSSDIPHSIVPLVIPSNQQIQRATISVDQQDTTNDYALRIYSDPAGSPSLVATLVTLTSGNVNALATGLTVNLTAGNYGLAVQRTSGSGRSDFRNIVTQVLMVEQ